VHELPAWRRRETLAVRGLLRAMLTELIPDAVAATLARRPHGQPMLADWPHLAVSLSHDGEAVAAAVAIRRRVGVDVQLPPNRVADGMLRRCLRQRADELAALPSPDRAREFAWVWSVQEACVKANGTGIAGRPWSIDVPVRPRSGHWRDLTWLSLREHSDIPIACAFGELSR
jgi:4'-phosphopantetheinyl transferase